MKPVIGRCDQPLIDWQAIQPILEVHDCFQVWICGGKRWHSWYFCLLFVACMLATTLYLSLKPPVFFSLTLIFTWPSLFCVGSFIFIGWTSRSFQVSPCFSSFWWHHPLSVTPPLVSALFLANQLGRNKTVGAYCVIIFRFICFRLVLVLSITITRLFSHNIISSQSSRPEMKTIV